MPYAILRFKKCKMGGITAAYAHNERKKESYKSNPDIVPERRVDNYHLVQPRQNYRREVQHHIKQNNCKVRSNSTVMVETLITASPEFMASLPPPQQREFFQRALDFVASRVGQQNFISAVVHMDEKTPHMHLSFCPIVENAKGGKSLSAKDLLGNQAALSRWQTDFHAAMSGRWPELERGVSSMITKRKHIPLSLFKAAERLDKQFSEVEKAISDITVFNTGKQRDKAVSLLKKWVPEAERFTVRMKEMDGYIKDLEKAEKETQKRIAAAEYDGDERVREVRSTMREVLSGKDDELEEKDKQILAARREAYQAADKLRRHQNSFERLLGRLPLEVKQRIHDEQQKMADKAIMKKDRGFQR